MPSITEEIGTNHLSTVYEVRRNIIHHSSVHIASGRGLVKLSIVSTWPHRRFIKKEPFSTLSVLLIEALEAFTPVPLTSSGNQLLREMSKELNSLSNTTFLTGAIIDNLEQKGPMEFAGAFVAESQEQFGDLPKMIPSLVDEIRRYKYGLEFSKIGPIWREVILSVMSTIRADLAIRKEVWKANQRLPAYQEVLLRFLASPSLLASTYNPERKSSSTPPTYTPGPGNDPDQVTPSATQATPSTTPDYAPPRTHPLTTPDDVSKRSHPSTTPDDASKCTHPPDDRAAQASFEAFNSAQGANVGSPVINQAAHDQTMTIIQNQNINLITVDFLSSPFSTILSSVIFDPILWKQPTIQPSFSAEVLKKLLVMLQDAAGFMTPAAAAVAATVVTAVLYERSMASMGQYMLIE